MTSREQIRQALLGGESLRESDGWRYATCSMAQHISHLKRRGLNITTEIHSIQNPHHPRLPIRYAVWLVTPQDRIEYLKNQGITP